MAAKRKTTIKKEPFPRESLDRVMAVMEALPRLRVSDEPNSTYTTANRASDFLAVFNGTSNADQGRRVLSQISMICDPRVLPGDADRHGTLALKSGQRLVLHEIMACMVSSLPIQVETS